MGNFPQNTHPLVRDGRSQEDRRLEALDPAYVKLDDRSLEQILEFIYEYARQVNYYDRALDRKDWLAFFQDSVPFQIARIIRIDLNQLRVEYGTVSAILQREPDYPAFNSILDFLFDLANQINFWREKLEKDVSGLKEFLDGLINTNLSEALSRLIAFANAANVWQYRSKYNFFCFKQEIWKLGFKDFLAVDKEFAASALNSRKASETPASKFIPDYPVVGKKQSLAAGKSKLDELFGTFLEAMGQVQEEAKAKLRASIDNDEAHEPHLGLFFAFLEIFGLARNDLNQITKRHLDFYYQKVLQLKEKEAVLDKAHLVFEVSPLEEKYLLEKGTRFTAGEDDSGVEMHFELEDNIVVDKALIGSLKTIYLEQVPVRDNVGAMPQGAAYQVKGIFVAPEANSADGQGEAFKDENNRSWETVGEKVSKFVDEEKTSSRDNPQFKLHPFAKLGIILGSKALFLQEGQRTITLKFACARPEIEKMLGSFAHFEEAVKTQYALTDQSKKALEENGFDFYCLPRLINRWKNGLSQYKTEVVDPHAGLLSSPQRDLLVKYAERRSCFDVYLTIDGEWLLVPEVQIYTEPDGSDLFNLVIKMELDENQPPIIAFDPEAHGLNLNLAAPAVKLEFNHEFVPSGPIGTKGISLYNYFRFLKVLEVNCIVDARNVRDLVLQNNDGVFGADAPFLPFGADPQAGENFYIGSQEIFQKNLTSLRLHFNWGGLPEAPFWLHYLGYQPFPKLSSTYSDFDSMEELEKKVLATQVKPEDFSFELKLLKNRSWQNFTVPSRFELFDCHLADGTKVGRPFAERFFDFTLSPSPLAGSDIPEEIEELGVGSTAGFMRLSLKPVDFRHKEFPDLLSQHLTAQGLWATEIAQAEQATSPPSKSGFAPVVRVPDVVYLRIEEMVALLRIATFELKSWIANLQHLFDKHEEALDNALNAIETPDYSEIRSFISGVKTAIGNAKNKTDAILGLIAGDPNPLDSFIDPNNPSGKKISFNEYLAISFREIKECLHEELLSGNLNRLIEKLEACGAGKDRLHYINLGAASAALIAEEAESRPLACVENLIDIAGVLHQFYTYDAGKEIASSTYYTHHIPVPKEPYTPEITSMSIDYRAETGSNQVAFFHLHPFEGTFREHLLGTGADQPELLPKFVDEGALYIGVSELRPGSNLHLLFQMAESTADPFTEQAEVKWSFLANNNWLPLENGFEVLSDETNGLIKSGVIKLAIPAAITNNNTILPPELYWIKAAAPERAKAVSEAIAVHAQAARVAFINRDNDLNRLSGPLKSGSIAEAVESFDEISSVNQFYDSFGGRPKEKNITYYTRVSERLRHKGRAVTLFDFERLILENFPQIYKAKCITHTLGRMAGAEEDDHLAPGFVAVAVIPNLQDIQFANRFEPRATVALLKDIEKLIRKKTSPFVRLRVLNPDYEPVNFSGNIGFTEGTDENFFKDKLRRDVQEFLAPWAFDPVAQVAFGGSIFRSTVLKFVEERPYVDFVTEFAMFGLDKKNVPDIAAPSARSILVPGRINFEAIECCIPSNS